MSNEVKYYLRGMLSQITLLFTAGGIVQTFFSELGFSSMQIGVYTSMVSIIQVLVMFLGLFYADRIVNIKKFISLLSLSPIIFCLPMMYFCVAKGISVDIIYIIALVLCTFHNLFYGFSNILIYRLPYLIIDIKNISGLENINGIVGGIFSIVVSFTITCVTAKFSFSRIMMVGFLFAAVSSILIAFLCHKMVIINDYEQEKTNNSFSFSILKKRVFAYFYIPNFLRGLSMGLMAMIAVVCMKDITKSPAVISVLATINSASAILGCFLYQLIKKYLNTKTVYLLSSIVQFVFLLFVLVGGSSFVFCTFYFIAAIGYNIVCVSGAVYPTEIVEYNEFGTYTSTRLIVMTLGQAVGGYIVGAVIDYVPTIIVLFVGGLCQLLSGVAFFAYKNK